MANWLDDVLKLYAYRRLDRPIMTNRNTIQHRGGVASSWGIGGLRRVCAPLTIYALYVLKIVGYVYGWIFFCGFSTGMGDLSTIQDWAFSPLAFQKAILWSMRLKGWVSVAPAAR